MLCTFDGFEERGIRVNNSKLMVHSVFFNDPGPIQRGLISGDKIQTPTLLYNTVMQGRTDQLGDVFCFFDIVL